MPDHLPPQFRPLERQFAFILELDRLKGVLRRNSLLDRSRRQREMRSWLWVIVVVWYSLVLVAIGVEFADYWSTLL